jgi:LEA14-like dessication related protein
VARRAAEEEMSPADRRSGGGGRVRVTPIILLALTPCAGCSELLALVQKPTVKVKRVDLKRVSFQDLAVDVVLTVDNPNPIGLPVARLDYQVTVDGHALASGRADSSLAIPAAGSADVTLPVAARWDALGATAQSLFERDELPYVISARVGFDVPGGSFDVPIEHQGTLPVPRPPQVELGAVSLGDIDFSGATLHVGLALTNPNRFALPLGALAYRISVEDREVANGSAQPGELAAGEKRPLDLALRIDFLRAGAAIGAAVAARSARVALDGELDVAGHALPLHLAGALAP